MCFRLLNTQTPLHLAAKNNQLSAMEALLSAGARADVCGAAGESVWDVCMGDGARDLLETFEAKRAAREAAKRGAAAGGKAGAGQATAAAGAVADGDAGSSGGKLAVARVARVSKAPEMPRFTAKGDAR